MCGRVTSPCSATLQEEDALRCSWRWDGPAGGRARTQSSPGRAQAGTSTPHLAPRIITMPVSLPGKSAAAVVPRLSPSSALRERGRESGAAWRDIREISRLLFAALYNGATRRAKKSPPQLSQITFFLRTRRTLV